VLLEYDWQGVQFKLTFRQISLLEAQIEASKSDFVAQRARFPPSAFEIDRNNLFHSSILQILSLSNYGPLKVKFAGEIGGDGGGLTKEFFSLLAKEFVDPARGYFQATKTEGKKLFPARFTSAPQDNFRAFGIFLGLAFKNSITLDVSFARPFYSVLMGKPLTFEDLEHLDTYLYSGLKQIRDNLVIENEYSTFEIMEDRFGTPVETPLGSNGSTRVVNEENKNEYLALIVNHFNEKHKEQFESVHSGFKAAVRHRDWFNERVAAALLEGQSQIDIDDWQRNTL